MNYVRVLTTPCKRFGGGRGRTEPGHVHARTGTRASANSASGLAHLARVATVLVLAGASAACTTETTEDEGDAVVLGAALPFTGDDATIGRNLEQALLLAVEDVERAGVSVPRLRLEIRDSNSGSKRGLDELLELLYEEHVQYLIGPEENELADEIVPDLKGLDVFNALPGYASPKIERVTRKGAWLRLSPSHLGWGCGIAELAVHQGVGSSNAIIARDDFNQNVASDFLSEYNDLGGHVISSVTVSNGDDSYAFTERALRSGAERTLLFVDPTTASTIVTEWAVGVREGNWLLGPTLHTPGFLQNVPHGSLDGAYAISPSLSLLSECQEKNLKYHGPVECRRTNAEAFSAHFASRWDGDVPFPAAYYYYDAVVLLAMGLEYAAAQGKVGLKPHELQGLILEMISAGTERGRWSDLPAVFETLSEGKPVAYVGAAAEYEFDGYGAAVHQLFDTWRVKDVDYVADETLQVRCVRQER